MKHPLAFSSWSNPTSFWYRHVSLKVIHPALHWQSIAKKKNPVVNLHNKLTLEQNRCFDGFYPGAGISPVSALLLCSTLLHFSRPAFSALALILIIPHWGLWGSKWSIIQRWSLRQLKAPEEWLFIWAERQRERRECVSGLVFPYHLG